MSAQTRTETDSLGSVEIPAAAYWGVHTARAHENFPIARRPISVYPVLALYMAILMGGAPIGAPLVGAAADALGARSTFVISGIAALLAFGIGVTWLIWKRELRIGWRSGIQVTHAGRPSVGGDRSRQTETLTAPLNVLRRGDADPLLSTGDSAPQDVPTTTGAIKLPKLPPEEGQSAPDEGHEG